MRKFEVVSKVFGAGVLSIGSDFDWGFDGKGRDYYRGTWRILSAECPAEWHKEQAETAINAALDGRDDDREPTGDATEPFDTPPGKWLTIVTDIGEVLGFEIVRDVL